MVISLKKHSKMTKEEASIEEARDSLATAASHLSTGSLAGYAPDTGRRHQYKDGKKLPGEKFLSYKKARIMGAQKHVGELRISSTTSSAKDTLVPFSLNAPFGAHDFDETSLCYKAPVCRPCRGCMIQGNSVLEPYGVGLVLYFKFLKYMTVVFLLMSFAVAPSISFFWLGSSFSTEDKGALMAESPLNALFLTTIGSLGSGTSSCAEATYGEVMDLKCPSGVFKSIEAHWGNPVGQCSCPPSQQINEQGNCAGQLIGLGDAETPWGQCANGACRFGETNLKEACCALDFNDPTDPTSGPDLTAVNIAADLSCYSSSAQYIAAGMCLGHKNCTFVLESNHSYSWEYTSKYDTECDEEWDASEGNICSRSLSSPEFKSNFTGCPAYMAGNSYAPGRSLTVVGLCVDEELTVDLLGFGEKTWMKEDMVMVLAYIDSGIVILFLFALHWLKKEEMETIDDSDAKNCSPSDYTIHVYNLPCCKTTKDLKEKLIEHFDRVLAENAKEDPPEEGAEPEDLSIFDVNFAVNNRMQVYWMKRRGQFARRKDKLENEVYMLNEWGKYKGKLKLKLQALHHYLETQFDVCNDRLEKIDEKIASGKKKEKASSAFITFSTEQGYVRARKMYPDLGVLHRKLMPRRHRMKNARGKRLIIRPAAEPSELIWENLGIKWWSNWLRLAFTTLFTIVLLAVSFVLIYQSKVAQEEAERKYPDADCTPYEVSTNMTLTKNITSLYDPTLGLEFLTPREVEKDVDWDFFNADIGNTGKLECFCKDLLIDPKQGLIGMYDFIFQGRSWDNSTSPATEAVTDEKWCREWFTTYTYIQTLKIIAVGGVVVTNVVLKEILKILISIEGHADKAHEIASVTIKVFLATFINTAFLTLLINGNLDLVTSSVAADDDLAVQKFGLLGGTYNDFGEEWYENIGVPIILTMIINMISPHISTVAQWLMKRYKQWADRSCSKDRSITKMVTQDDLEKMYTGPEFLLYLRYAQILNTLFVSLLFSSGMPLLVPICFLTFFSYYWVDKIMLLRFFSLPPRVDATLALAVGNVLQFSALLHLMFGMWMFSNEEFFKTEDIVLETNTTLSGVGGVDLNPASLDSSLFGESKFAGEVYDRLTHKNNLLSLFVFFFLILRLVWTKLIVKILTAYKGFFAMFPCLDRCFSDVVEAEGNPPFIEAISTEMMDIQIHLQLVSPVIVRKYKVEQERRTNLGHDYKEPERSIRILESYNFEANQDYIKAFATDSHSIQAIMRSKRESKVGGDAPFAGGGEGGGAEMVKKSDSSSTRIMKRMSGLNREAMDDDEKDREKKRMEHMKRMHMSSGGANSRSLRTASSASASSKKSKTDKKAAKNDEEPAPPAPPAPPVAPPPAVPPAVVEKKTAWEQRYDDSSGHYYYENVETFQTVWDAPTEGFKPMEVQHSDL